MSESLEAEATRLAQERDAHLSREEKKRHGIVHTPAPLARFVARCVDGALRELSRSGLSDPDVAIVDPACGPGAFLAAAFATAGEGAPRVALGIDRDGAAIERARELLSASSWSFRFAIADTLATLDPLRLHERAGATLAILGNPPWAGKSANRDRLEPLLEDFRRDARGEPLRERKIGVLYDDYVRFWRWACELARKSEAGAVVALVTNASFLDGPVHRGMRAAMARWFAQIDVLDLGGSSLIARSGERDENVFGVRPSVALTIAVRPPEHGATAHVRFAALRGAREQKLRVLSELASFEALAPDSIATDQRWMAIASIPPSYARWPSLAELVPFHREGLQSNRDAFCVDDDRERLLARLRAFAAGEPGPWPARAAEASPHYDPDKARLAVREALERDPSLEKGIVRVAYRPLDPRWMAIVPRVCHRSRPELLRAMERSELALLSVRKDRGQRQWAHFGAARAPVDNCFLSARSSCRTRAFPTHRPDGAPNVDALALSRFCERLSFLPSSVDLLHYALSVLAAPRYRERFDAALRADYPRLPPPSSDAVFLGCAAAGRALARAFDGPLGGTELLIGHHRIRSAALAEAITGSGHATELLGVG